MMQNSPLSSWSTSISRSGFPTSAVWSTPWYSLVTTPSYRLVIVTVALSLCTSQMLSNCCTLSPTFTNLEFNKHNNAVNTRTFSINRYLNSCVHEIKSFFLFYKFLESDRSYVFCLHRWFFKVLRRRYVAKHPL